jgi:hypothetical protein
MLNLKIWFGVTKSIINHYFKKLGHLWTEKPFAYYKHSYLGYLDSSLDSRVSSNQ